jgi:arginase
MGSGPNRQGRARRYAVIEAPSALGLQTDGVAHLPGALLAAGLAELAFATGRGPELLTDIDGAGPLVRDDDVALFGLRDADERAADGCQPIPPGMRTWDLPRVRRLGGPSAAREAADHLTRSDLDGFWIHLDADVLDDAVMPAVDYRLPGGLAPSELVTVLTAAMATGRAVGFEVTIYNPTLDPTGAAGRELARILGQAL